MKWLALAGLLIGFVLGVYAQQRWPSTWDWLTLRWTEYQHREKVCPPAYACTKVTPKP